MGAPSNLQELRFGNFAIDLQRGSRTLIQPPLKETSPESSFSDYRCYQESSYRDPAPVGKLNKEALVSHAPPEESLFNFPTFEEYSDGRDPSQVGSSSVDSRDSHAPPEPSAFSFLDSPSFQESNEPPPVTASLYPTEIWGPQSFHPAPAVTASLYPTDNAYVNEVFPWIFQLMTDQPKTFENLLDLCAAPHLGAILEKFMLEKESFFHVALCENGSRSIQSLVKKIRHTSLERYLTFAISCSAVGFMSRKHAWHVVEECFKTLSDQANETLYEHVLQNFQPLSMLQHGCLTINAMMNNVRGNRLVDLLYLVLKNVSQLSFCPTGNFVVQNCLSLRHELVNHEICKALKMDFVELARKEGGSFVVQKCIQYSNDAGRGLVLGDMFKDDRTMLMLAKDRFGNYPVQMALVVSWIRDMPMYEKLVKVLQPQFAWLIQRAHDELLPKLLASL